MDEGRVVVVVGMGAVRAVSESIKEEIEFGSKEADEEAVAASSAAVAELGASLEVALRLEIVRVFSERSLGVESRKGERNQSVEVPAMTGIGAEKPVAPVESCRKS